MEHLCASLSVSCAINHTPKLYNMLISDLNQLALQYISELDEYTFMLEPEFEYVDMMDINELIIYIQRNNDNIESLLRSIIHNKSPTCHITVTTLYSLLDYYLECLMMSV